MEECGKQATKFRAGQRVVCVPSKAWSALDGSGTWQQAWHPPQPRHSACSLYEIWSVNPCSEPGLCSLPHPPPSLAACASSITFPALQIMLVPETNLYPVPDEVTDRVAAQFSVSVLIMENHQHHGILQGSIEQCVRSLAHRAGFHRVAQDPREQSLG